MHERCHCAGVACPPQRVNVSGSSLCGIGPDVGKASPGRQGSRVRPSVFEGADWETLSLPAGRLSPSGPDGQRGLPGFSTWADSINDHDQVSGVLYSQSAPQGLFIWDEAGGLRNLNAPYPISSASPTHINNAGHIVGLWTCAGADRPFRWNGSTFTELPDVAPGWVRSIRRLTDGGMVLYDGPPSSCGGQTAVLFAGALHRVDQVLGSCWTARDIADGTRGNFSHMFVTDPTGASSEFTPLAGNIYITPGITAAVAPATYHIRIRARNAGGVSPPSNEVMVVVP